MSDLAVLESLAEHAERGTDYRCAVYRCAWMDYESTWKTDIGIPITARCERCGRERRDAVSRFGVLLSRHYWPRKPRLSYERGMRPTMEEFRVHVVGPEDPGNEEQAMSIESVIQPAKAFVCPQCGKSYDSRLGLQGHSISHKPAVHCPECGKEYRSPGALGNHRKHQHGVPSINGHGHHSDAQGCMSRTAMRSYTSVLTLLWPSGVVPDPRHRPPHPVAGGHAAVLGEDPVSTDIQGFDDLAQPYPGRRKPVNRAEEGATSRYARYGTATPCPTGSTAVEQVLPHLGAGQGPRLQPEQSIRLWETKGLLPRSPYRSPRPQGKPRCGAPPRVGGSGHGSRSNVFFGWRRSTR